VATKGGDTVPGCNWRLFESGAQIGRTAKDWRVIEIEEKKGGVEI